MSDRATSESQALPPTENGRPEAISAPGASDAQWPARWALVTAWIVPARTARHMTSISLQSAYVVHVIAAMLGAAAIAILIWVAMRADDMIVSYLREFARAPVATVLSTIAVTVGVEFGFVVLAIVVLPWGAGDEPIGASFANALRRTWLHTATVLPAVLVVGLVLVPLDGVSDRVMNDVYASAPPYPTYPENALPASPAMKAYEAEMDAYSEAWNEAYAKCPWYVRYADGLIAATVLLVSAWVGWVLLRMIGTPRRIPPPDRAPMCEGCGYNLSHLPTGGRCVECGLVLTESLGPDVRPGAIWERRREVGRLRAWWRCGIDAIAHPTQFGRRIRVFPMAVDHRTYVAISALAAWVLGYCGMLGFYVVVTGRNPFTWDPELAWLVAPIVGSISAATLVGLCLAVASVLGLIAQWRHKRNLLHAATQVACYLSPFLLISELVLLAGMCATVALRDSLFAWVENTLNISSALLAPMCIFLPDAIMAAVYLILVWRGMMGARYANASGVTWGHVPEMEGGGAGEACEPQETRHGHAD